jgi:predicted transcriptional regulator
MPEITIELPPKLHNRLQEITEAKKDRQPDITLEQQILTIIEIYLSWRGEKIWE